VTGFTFAHGTVADVTSPVSMPLHLLAAEQPDASAVGARTAGASTTSASTTSASTTSDGALRAAIVKVCNAIFNTRDPMLWGEGTTACASDSKQFGAWDQNLITEWHMRYGGRGVMIYWHVEKNSVCVYSQLKAPSSSEVTSMIEGVLRHDTEDGYREAICRHAWAERSGLCVLLPLGL